VLGLICKDRGRHREADRLLRDALHLRRRILGPRHPDTAMAEYNLACNLARSGRRDEALATLRESIENGLPAFYVPLIEQDSDMESLRGDSRFAALIAEAKSRAAK
jgi:tetratricopeptide (TPR) repeat protein